MREREKKAWMKVNLWARGRNARDANVDYREYPIDAAYGTLISFKGSMIIRTKISIKEILIFNAREELGNDWFANDPQIFSNLRPFFSFQANFIFFD